MKKIYLLSVAVMATFLITGCTSSSQNVAPMEKRPLSIQQINDEVATKVSMLSLETDGRVICSIEKNGIQNVIQIAKVFNQAAISKGLEFRRLGVNNSGLIASVEEAIKTGETEVNPKDFKGKPSKTKLETNYAAERACKFALSALQQAHEAKSTWRLAIPGDGFKY
jgi:hypothetical protein